MGNLKQYFNYGWLVFICFTVYFGYRKSHKFHKKLEEMPEDVRQSYVDDIVKRKGPLSFWESGAIRKLPTWLTIIGNLLAIAVLLAILGLMLGLFALYKGWLS